MNDLEGRTLADGFVVLLLGAWRAATAPVVDFEARLFNGGRQRGDARGRDAEETPEGTPPIESLRPLLRQVLAPPHILAVCGSDWREVVSHCFPNLQEEFRTFDLRRAAAALCGVPPTAGVDRLAGGFGLPAAVSEGRPALDTYEELLWAVIHEAGNRGLDWPALLELGSQSASAVSFAPYEFSRDTLDALPDTPGVYVMRGEGGKVLYVGKAARLAARLNDYFRSAFVLPPKLERLRADIRALDWHRVGCELEALLVENRLIGELGPEVNVQRAIVPGSSRYVPHHVAVAILAPSVRQARCELFFFGAREQAIQLSVDPRRPPARVIQSLIRFFCGRSPDFRRHPHMILWGAAGNEICHRYWSRFRNGLSWVELTLPAQEAQAQLRLVLGAMSRSQEPAEFRLE